MTGLTVGVDVGSTWVKALACDPDGTVVAHARQATPWQGSAGGRAELDPHLLVGTVERLLDEVTGAGVPASIGVSGMAEAGVLIGPDGPAPAPIFAWFDPRGLDELLATPAGFREEFPGRTGLTVSALPSLAKLLHLRAHGVEPGRYRWLSGPEFVVHSLGGDVAAETSLASRTGLLDQDTAGPWAEALALLGAPAGFLPDIRTAGDSWGRHRRTGAVLTVAGHDHLVASVAAGVVEESQLYDSMGTAEALVRPLHAILPAAERARLAVAGVNSGRHVVPGSSVLIAGAKTGLLLRRVLQLVGVNDSAGREALDGQVLALPPGAADAVSVTGARNDDGVLAVRTEADGLSPAVLFAATLAHTTEEVRQLLALMHASVAPPRTSVVSGGWSQMEAVRAARRALLPGVTFSVRAEDTAYGAALFGAFAASGATEFVEFLREELSPTQ